MSKYALLIFQGLFWIISMSFAAGTYFHTQETVNAKVKKVESEAKTNSKILCLIAIDFKVKKAQDICTRQIFTR